MIRTVLVLAFAATSTGVAQRPRPTPPVVPRAPSVPTRPTLPADLYERWLDLELEPPGAWRFEMPDWAPMIAPFEAVVPGEWSDFVAPDIAERVLDVWDERATLAPLATLARGPRSRWLRQEPRDSLYRRARDLLNKGEYRKAADHFATFAKSTKSTRYQAASMYWRAFALYRAGTETDLRLAASVLQQQRDRFPQVATDADVSALVTRVTGALAARGDAEAARQLRAGAASQSEQSCDKEDMEVRAEALSALVQTDPGSASAVLTRILGRRDECSVTLRRRAVYLIGREGTPAAARTLADVARDDPNTRVRSDAISRLAQIPGAETLPTLERLLAAADDERTQRAVVQALRRVEDPAASAILRRVIEREDLPDRVRTDAITSLARLSAAIYTVRPGQVAVVAGGGRRPMSESDAAFLRAQYARTDSRNIRSAILRTLARSGGDASDQWLMGIVRDTSQDMRFRTTALGRLRRADVPIAELTGLYDRLTERRLRSSLVSILGSRKEDAATDKLIDIARRGTDPSIQKAAISALARKKDPRTTKLLLELVEKN